MNIRKLVFVSILLPGIFFSCVTDGKLIKIDPYSVFHENSSKVWLINHCYKDGKDFSPVSNKYKEIITFYKSENCYIQRMDSFGDEAGRKATFTVNGAKRKVRIDYGNDAWDFKMKVLSHQKIVLVPDEEKFPYTLELIPVPEP